MERLSNGPNTVLAGMYVGLAAIKPRVGCLWIAAYLDEARGLATSAGMRLSAERLPEFCVHGIVVHLRLGNCIGYSLRELNAGIGLVVTLEAHEQGILQRRDLETLRMDASLKAPWALSPRPTYSDSSLSFNY